MNIQRIRRLKLFFFLSALLLFFIFLIAVKNLLVSFLLAFVGFYLLDPVVEIFERRGLSRAAAVTLPFVFFSVVLTVLGQALGPLLISQFSHLKGDFPKYVEQAQSLSVVMQGRMEAFLTADFSKEIVDQGQVKVMNMAQEIFRDLPEHISNSLTVLFMAPFLCFFMLLDGKTLMRQVFSLVPNQLFELILNLHYQISSQMGGFIRARLFESLIVSFIVFMGLAVIGFPYALLLAFGAGLLNLIPYIGPIIGALPAFGLALLNGADSTTYVILTLIYGGAQVIDTVIIVPFLVARIVNLHPVTVVLSVLVGSQVMGILGMIISIPLTSALKVTIFSLYRHLTQFRDN